MTTMYKRRILLVAEIRESLSFRLSDIPYPTMQKKGMYNVYAQSRNQLAKLSQIQDKLYTSSLQSS